MPASTGADTVGGGMVRGRRVGNGIVGSGKVGTAAASTAADASSIAPPDDEGASSISPRSSVPSPPAPAESGQAPKAGGLFAWFGRLRRRPAPVTIYIAVLAVLSATAAALVHHLVFPVLSINNDEGIYLLHAQTLAEGRLFPPTPDQPGSFTPWLAVADGDHYVLKYTPFVPGLFAASIVLTGGVTAALALVAGATVVTTYLLGREVFGDRRVAAVAATLLAASPLVVVQSAMLVGYLPVLLLSALAMLGLLRALRTGRRLPLVGGAFTFGCAAAVRPYDVVLVFVPLVVWAIVSASGRRWWLVGWSAAGLAVPAVVLLASNTAATGSPFSLPFAVLESSDTVGFGTRRLYPTDISRQFGILDGLSGVGAHLWLLGGWGFAGVLLLGCAVAALLRRRVPAPGAMIGAGALLLLVGYLGFWGVWNAADLWGGISYVGPFYVLPVLLPLVLLGSRGLVDLAAARPKIASGSVVLAGALSVFVAVTAIQTNLTFSRHDQDLAALVENQPDRPLVFVALDPPFLGRPATFLANPPSLDGDVLYAVSRGRVDFAVAADHPERPVYLLRVPVAFNHTPSTRSTAALDRLEVVSGSSVEIDVTIDPAPDDATAARFVVSAGGRRSSYRIDPERGATATFVVSADGLQVRGLGRPTSVTFLTQPSDRSVHFGYYSTLASTGKEHFVDRYVLPVRTTAASGSGSGSGEADTDTEVEAYDVQVMAPAEQVGQVGDGRQPTFHLDVG